MEQEKLKYIQPGDYLVRQLKKRKQRVRVLGVQDELIFVSRCNDFDKSGDALTQKDILTGKWKWIISLKMDMLRVRANNEGKIEETLMPTDEDKKKKYYGKRLMELVKQYNEQNDPNNYKQ
jgi:hypothetical protein